jgi:ketopantoate reductase
VLLCVKALPDVYNLADIIQSVVTPQHTCILVNTTTTLGVEKQLEERFPTNVVLSIVSGADLNQLGSTEFEHSGSTEIWVGPAKTNSAIPEAIQNDMSEALAMTLTTAQVDCKVSPNIRQQQFERMIGLVLPHPAVTPSLTGLLVLSLSTLRRCCSKPLFTRSWFRSLEFMNSLQM